MHRKFRGRVPSLEFPRYKALPPLEPSSKKPLRDIEIYVVRVLAIEVKGDYQFSLWFITRG